MKKIIISTVLCLLFCFSANLSSSQIVDPGKVVKNEGENRVNKGINNGVDKSFDKLEGGIKDLFRKDKKDKKETDKNEADEESTNNNNQNSDSDKNIVIEEIDPVPELKWAKYDFVPGDIVIFEDNQTEEENGEFPLRWDLVRGTAEIANFDGEDVIMLRGGQPTIIPYLKNANEDYLPEVFTVEMDMHFKSGTTVEVFFWDRKNQKQGPGEGWSLRVSNTSMNVASFSSSHPDARNLKAERWIHVALAYNHGKLKAYMDDTRLINIPHLEFKPTGITIYNYHANDHYKVFVKNIRIAEGGIKYYDRILQDGKIISNGIRFETGKATLRPESMGVINEIYELLNEHPDLKFSIEGHTDSDGSESSNLLLSELRSETVMNTLIKMGISSERLKSKGFGESVPIDSNDTPEGKANNRRVEFVKI